MIARSSGFNRRPHRGFKVALIVTLLAHVYLKSRATFNSQTCDEVSMSSVLFFDVRNRDSGSEFTYFQCCRRHEEISAVSPRQVAAFNGAGPNRARVNRRYTAVFFTTGSILPAARNDLPPRWHLDAAEPGRSASHGSTYSSRTGASSAFC